MRLDSSSLINGLADMQLKVERATNLYAETSGIKMINDDKIKAPWTDRTGNSRQTMDHKITKSGTTTRISLRGNTPHFKYLELCHEKKNAILWPTIQRWSGQVLSGWSKII